LHRVALQVITWLNSPLVIHITDDWLSVLEEDNSSLYKRLDTDIRWLLQRAEYALSANKAMTLDFLERYSTFMIPITNDINQGKWSEPIASNKLESEAMVSRFKQIMHNASTKYQGGISGIASFAAEMDGTKTKTFTMFATATLISSLFVLLPENIRWLFVPLSYSSLLLFLSQVAFLDYDRYYRMYQTIPQQVLHRVYAYFRPQYIVIAILLIILGTVKWLIKNESWATLLGLLEAIVLIALITFTTTLRVPRSIPNTGFVKRNLARFQQIGRPTNVLFLMVIALVTSQAPHYPLLHVAQIMLVVALINIIEPDKTLDSADSHLNLQAQTRASKSKLNLYKQDAGYRIGTYLRSEKAHVDEVEAVRRLLEQYNRPDVMVDVGAHHGSSAHHFLAMGWQVLAFEPDASNRTVLGELAKKYSKLVIDPRAVSNHSAEGVQFFTSTESTGISSLSPFTEGHKLTGQVDLTTLTDVLQEHDITKISFLKIDTEGHDLFVLQGFPWDSYTIPDVVVCEFEDRKTIPLGYTVADLADFLIGKGYHLLLSEWHPIIKYGITHDWHGLKDYPCSLDNEQSWGNLIAFKSREHLERYIELLRETLTSTSSQG
jgi:FkbM family methyltransferase